MIPLLDHIKNDPLSDSVAITANRDHIIRPSVENQSRMEALTGFCRLAAGLLNSHGMSGSGDFVTTYNWACESAYN